MLEVPAGVAGASGDVLGLCSMLSARACLMAALTCIHNYSRSTELIT